MKVVGAESESVAVRIRCSCLKQNLEAIAGSNKLGRLHHVTPEAMTYDNHLASNVKYAQAPSVLTGARACVTFLSLCRNHARRQRLCCWPGFVGREDSSNGQVSEVRKRTTVWQQSPVVEEGDTPQLERKYPKSDVDGEWQTCLQASLYCVPEDSHQSLSSAAALLLEQPTVFSTAQRQFHYRTGAVLF